MTSARVAPRGDFPRKTRLRRHQRIEPALQLIEEAVVRFALKVTAG